MLQIEYRFVVKLCQESKTITIDAYKEPKSFDDSSQALNCILEELDKLKETLKGQVCQGD